VTDKTVIISWTVYSGEQPEKIKIQYQVTNSGDWKSIEVAGTATSYNLNGLQPISPYQVQVIVIKEGKESSARQSGLRTNINLGMLRLCISYVVCKCQNDYLSMLLMLLTIH